MSNVIQSDSAQAFLDAMPAPDALLPTTNPTELAILRWIGYIAEKKLYDELEAVVCFDHVDRTEYDRVNNLTTDKCIGWARRELVRRGWSVGMHDSHPLDSCQRLPTHVLLTKNVTRTSRKEYLRDRMYHACTLLDCYLDAIEATNPDKENDNG